MFGTNAIEGKKAFADLAKDELMVTSIFPTLQGEGPFSGMKAVFVRLSKCNLACSFCDTAFDTGTVYQFEELRDEMMRVVNEFNKKHGVKPIFTKADEEAGLTLADYDIFEDWILVFTGGEPFLQSNLDTFIERLNYGYSPERLFNIIQIESNGIIPPGEYVLEESSNVTVVVSPKCVEKDGKPIRYITPHNTSMNRADCLKFVLTADQSSPYSQVPDWAFEWAKVSGQQIYVSPMAEYNKDSEEALKYAKQNPDNSIEQRNLLEKISFWEEGLLDKVKCRANYEYAGLYAMKHNCHLSLQTHLLVSLP